VLTNIAEGAIYSALKVKARKAEKDALMASQTHDNKAEQSFQLNSQSYNGNGMLLLTY
jgi:hypothetical protein